VPGTLLYLDSSALVKLVVTERESAALFEFARAWTAWITSRVAAVELMRAARRAAVPQVVERAAHVLDSLAFIELDVEVAELAGTLEPTALLSLDAVHLASALSVSTDVETFVTYDRRLADAAGAMGLHAQAPA
jgi:predicted nucleic acid-binding protein